MFFYFYTLTGVGSLRWDYLQVCLEIINQEVEYIWWNVATWFLLLVMVGIISIVRVRVVRGHVVVTPSVALIAALSVFGFLFILLTIC